MSLLCILLALLISSKRVHGLPHLVYVALDDWAWHALGSHAPGSAEVQTPHLDALTAQGALLDRFYTHRFCSPSRSSLHTGRSPIHVNVLNDDLSRVNLADPVSGFAGVPRNMTALPAKLRTAGYRTVQGERGV